MSAPVTEIIAAPAVVEEVIRPVQTQQPRNLLAMGNVISERVITVEELADTGRFFEDEAVREPVRTVVQPAPVMIETIQAAPVMAAPVVYETMAAPVMYETIQAAPVEMIQAAPMVEYVSNTGVVY